jgi:hypothetical protein
MLLDAHEGGVRGEGGGVTSNILRKDFKNLGHKNALKHKIRDP